MNSADQAMLVDTSCVPRDDGAETSAAKVNKLKARIKRILTPKRLLTACLIALTLTVASAAEQEPDSSKLAREIMADQSLPAVHRMAEQLLRSGLTAGSGYGEVWIRDLNTFIEMALEVNEPARFRESLLTFFKFQGTNGNIVDGWFFAVFGGIAG